MPSSPAEGAGVEVPTPRRPSTSGSVPARLTPRLSFAAACSRRPTWSPRPALGFGRTADGYIRARPCPRDPRLIEAVERIGKLKTLINYPGKDARGGRRCGPLALIGLGSNLGDRNAQATLDAAIGYPFRRARDDSLRATSSYHETRPPWGGRAVKGAAFL